MISQRCSADEYVLKHKLTFSDVRAADRVGLGDRAIRLAAEFTGCRRLGVSLLWEGAAALSSASAKTEGHKYCVAPHFTSLPFSSILSLHRYPYGVGRMLIYTRTPKSIRGRAENVFTDTS